MEQRYNHGAFPPLTADCVTRDLRLARAMEELYVESVALFASASYRAMLCRQISPQLEEFFFEQMHGEIDHFRALGDLILALGGIPTLRTQIRVEPISEADLNAPGERRLAQRLCAAAIREKKHWVDRCQTLLGRSEDRVVRSLLLELLAAEKRQIEHLELMEKS